MAFNLNENQLSATGMLALCQFFVLVSSLVD